jgi:hypothetical protein
MTPALGFAHTPTRMLRPMERTLDDGTGDDRILMRKWRPWRALQANASAYWWVSNLKRTFPPSEHSLCVSYYLPSARPPFRLSASAELVAICHIHRDDRSDVAPLYPSARRTRTALRLVAALFAIVLCDLYRGQLDVTGCLQSDSRADRGDRYGIHCRVCPHRRSPKLA